MTAADHQEPLLKRREEQKLKHVELVGRIAPLLSAAIPRQVLLDVRNQV